MSKGKKVLAKDAAKNLISNSDEFIVIGLSRPLIIGNNNAEVKYIGKATSELGMGLVKLLQQDQELNRFMFEAVLRANDTQEQIEQ
jgi:hypothetical protein